MLNFVLKNTEEIYPWLCREFRLVCVHKLLECGPLGQPENTLYPNT